MKLIKNLIHWLLTGNCRMCVQDELWGFFPHERCLVHNILKLDWPMQIPLKEIALWTDMEPPLYIGVFSIVGRKPPRLKLFTYYRQPLAEYLERADCVRFILGRVLSDKHYEKEMLPWQFQKVSLDLPIFWCADSFTPLTLVLKVHEDRASRFEIDYYGTYDARKICYSPCD